VISEPMKISNNIAERIMCLPMSHDLTPDDIQKITQCL